MKYFILVPDGAADYPIESLSGKTPLEAAKIPALDEIAARSETGTVKTIPAGIEPGSDVANLSILGYDPEKYYTGRGPLEAAYHGIEAQGNETIFRCNLVTVKNGKLVDYSASHIESTQAAELIGYLDQIIGGVDFYSGVSYRHLAIMKGDYEDIKFHPPHDVIGKDLEEIYPKGPKSKTIINIYKESNKLLEDHPINTDRRSQGKNPANMVWFWGAGKDVKLPSFKDKYQKSGAVISAVDLLKGIAKKTGMMAVEVPGATGYFDTDYGAKVKAAIEISKEIDVVMIHVEAPDEAGHSGDPALKVKALEDFDHKLVRPLLKGMEGKDFRMLVLPDHYTPLSVKTHTSEPVPFACFDNSKSYKGLAKSFNEFQLAKSGISIEDGYQLLEKTLFI